MKIFLIIIKLVLFPYILFSQGIITNELSSKMIASNENEFISIIIEINDEFEPLELKHEFHNNNTPRDLL